MSVAGTLLRGNSVLVVDPERMFSIDISILVLLMAVLGGIGTLWGPALGAAILVPLFRVHTDSPRRHRARRRSHRLWNPDPARVHVPPARPHERDRGADASAPGSAMTPLLVVEGLTKRFGGLIANDDITFRRQEGEILGVIGPNGAGSPHCSIS